MKNGFRLALYCVAFLFFAVSVSAWEFDGECVVQDSPNFSLRVCPHTVWNPARDVFVQTFELTNKSGQDRNVFGAYWFDHALQRGKAELFVEPVYGWVSYPHQCAPPNTIDYNLNMYPLQRNKHHGICQFQSDQNTPDPADDINILVWDLNFASFNAPTWTVFHDENEVVSGNSWNDVSDLFVSANYEGGKLYYSSANLLLHNQEMRKWRISYRPSANADSNKWNLFLYADADENAQCILDDSCDLVRELDPWWDVSYSKRYPVDINTSYRGDLNVGDAINMTFDTTGWDCADNNSLALVYHNGASMTDQNIKILLGTCNVGSGDMNIMFKSQFAIPANSVFTSSDTNGYFVYVTDSSVFQKRDANLALDLSESFEEGSTNGLVVESGANQILSDQHIDGAYSLAQSGGAANSNYWPMDSTGGVNTYGGWMRVTDSTVQDPYIGVHDGAGWVSIVRGDTATGRLMAFGETQSTCAAPTYRDFTPQVNFTNGQWFFVRIVAYPNDANYYATVYDSSFTKLGDANFINGHCVANAVNRFYVGTADTSTWIDDVYFYKSSKDANHEFSLGSPSDAFQGSYLSPTNGDYWNADNNKSIDFNVTSADNYLRVRVYRSSTAKAFETLLLDMNLSAIAENPTSDYNCGASNALDFSTGRGCYLDWNVMTGDSWAGDGNFFIDYNINVYSTDANVTFSSPSFVIDTNKPSTTWDGNLATWQRTDSNIHLACVDSFTCPTLYYRVDSDASSAVSMGAWTVFDQNKIFFVANGDGNYAIDFNSTDLAGNVGDTNRQFVLLDNNAPFLIATTPASDSTIGSNTFNFVFTVSDGTGSRGEHCDYNAYVDNVPIAGQQNQLGTISADGLTCTISFGYLPLDGQQIDVNAAVFDYVDMNSSNTKSFAYTYSSVSPPPAGGGGSPSPEDIVVPSLVTLTPSTNVVELYKLNAKKYYITATSLSDEPLSIKVTVSDSLKAILKLDGEETVTLEPKKTKTFSFTAQAVQEGFQPVSGDISFSLNEGQSIPKVPLAIRSTGSPDWLESLMTPVAGIPLLFIIVVLVILFFISREIH